MTRYPESTQANLEDFRRSGWKEAVESARRDGYSSMWQALSSQARKTADEGKMPEAKVLWLLADACSMMLSPSSTNEPFKPFAVMGGNRSALPEDFEDSDLQLFASIVGEIDDIWLRARIADLVWLLKRPRVPSFALAAIDAYRAVPLDTKTWVAGGRECWERALVLARLLKAGAGDRMKEMETETQRAFDHATPKDGFLAFWLADLFLENGLGQSSADRIAERLRGLAVHFQAEGDLHRAREYFELAAKWYVRSGDDAKSIEMVVCVAETWVREAVARMSSEQPSNMAAATFFERAIHVYRSITRKSRDAHDVDARIAELHREMSAAGEKTIGEMGVVSSGPIDLSALVERAREHLRGQSPLDALACFANIYQGARVEKLRQFAENLLREHSLQSLFSATHMSRDGRVIARRPGISLSDPAAEESKAVVWAEMVKHYGMELGIVVQGSIWPALEVLQLEHRIREADFISVALSSPIVPSDRHVMFGKALFAGYDKDFVAALHILVPQIEHMVRWHLKARDIKTTTLDSSGIENENGLSTLVELPQVNDIFGPDITFELKALFCDPFGPNLRNELAHGLLDHNACESIYSLYAWWFGLKIVFNTFWNHVKTQVRPESAAPGMPDGAEEPTASSLSGTSEDEGNGKRS